MHYKHDYFMNKPHLKVYHVMWNFLIFKISPHISSSSSCQRIILAWVRCMRYGMTANVIIWMLNCYYDYATRRNYEININHITHNNWLLQSRRQTCNVTGIMFTSSGTSLPLLLWFSVTLIMYFYHRSTVMHCFSLFNAVHFVETEIRKAYTVLGWRG